MNRPPSPALESIDWHAFLGRPGLPRPAPDSLGRLKSKSILVTGAGGSIGSALSLQLATLSPRKLILLEASEQALYRLRINLSAYTGDHQITTILGNAGDTSLLEKLFTENDLDLIFHAAAHKHLPLLEQQPIAAIVNNTLTTDTLTALAQQHRIARVVLLSTDKAVEPTSILGASKAIAEQVTLSRGGVVLRLANVLGTEGSVVETFLNQIASGLPISITHPDSRRYFLTSAEAVDLLLSASIEGPSQSLLIPQLSQTHAIVKLAQFLIEQSSSQAAIPIQFTALQPGEKITEQLQSLDEQTLSQTHYGCTRIEANLPHPQALAQALDKLRITTASHDLAATIAAIHRLVPGYNPSSAILALAEASHTELAQ